MILFKDFLQTGFRSRLNLASLVTKCSDLSDCFIKFVILSIYFGFCRAFCNCKGILCVYLSRLYIIK